MSDSESNLTSEVRAQIVKSSEELLQFEGQWRALFAATHASPVLSWDWVQTWWSIFGDFYGAEPGGMRVILVWRKSELIGALPLYERVDQPLGLRRLGFISTGETDGPMIYPEYLDLLWKKGEADACLSALEDVLFKKSGLEWDELDLGITNPESPLSMWSETQPSCVRGYMIKRSYPCPIADLTGGFEAYLKRLSSNSRQLYRRILRQVEQAGFAFSLAKEPSDIELFLTQLIDLHQARWNEVGHTGAFSTDKLKEFHSAILCAIVPKGQALIARLCDAKGAPIAVLYGFLREGYFEFYQSGVSLNNTSEVQSPGIAAHLLCMQQLSSMGIHTYDFLAGEATYKERLSTANKELQQLRFFRPSFRGALFWGSSLLRRVLVKVERKIFSYE